MNVIENLLVGVCKVRNGHERMKALVCSELG